MTVFELLQELQELADKGHGRLTVLADGDSGFYDPAVTLDAHGSLDDPSAEKYIRIFPAS